MSSTDKPVASEPASTSSNNLSKSFADRLTFPSTDKSKATSTDTTTTSSSKFNWADEVETPIQEKSENSLGKSQTDGAADQEEDSSLSMAQSDGATTWLNGSQGLDEPEFDVSVKLADLQDDPNNPLYSVKDFQDLNLYVTARASNRSVRSVILTSILGIDVRSYSAASQP